MIQPFALFGLTPQSTAEDIRRAYYQLALVCHPDKGGNAADMRMVQQAYEWICKHFQWFKEKGMPSLEEVQADFETYEVPSLPSFSWVCLEAHGISASEIREACQNHLYVEWIGHELYRYVHLHGPPDNVATLVQEIIANLEEKEATMYPAAVEGGYDACMIHESVENTYVPSQKREVIVYQEPSPFLPFHGAQCGHPGQLPKQLEDYTIQDTSLCMVDYMDAYKEGMGVDEPPGEEPLPLEQQLEMLQLERCMMDMDTPPSPTDPCPFLPWTS
jgi:hypothetical protein